MTIFALNSQSPPPPFGGSPPSIRALMMIHTKNAKIIQTFKDDEKSTNAMLQKIRNWWQHE